MSVNKHPSPSPGLRAVATAALAAALAVLGGRAISAQDAHTLQAAAQDK
jgi:hypothetical protein